MARFCTGCGSELRDGVAFCTECGAKAEIPAQVQPASQSVPQPTASHTSAAENSSPVVSTAAYFGMMLLFALPVIGWIACIIMAFAPKNENVRHFARANLIWLLIAALLASLLYLAVSALIEFAAPYIEQIRSGDFGELGGYAEIFEQFGDLKDILDGLETIPNE